MCFFDIVDTNALNVETFRVFERFYCGVFMQLISQIRGGCRRKSIRAGQSSLSYISNAAALLATLSVIHMATGDQSTCSLQNSCHEPEDECVEASNENCGELTRCDEAMSERDQSVAVSESKEDTIISQEERLHQVTEASTFARGQLPHQTRVLSRQSQRIDASNA